MWLMEIKTVPDKVFDKAKEPVSKSDRKELLDRSTCIAAVGDGRELMFVLGILPPTILSTLAYLWLTRIDGVEFTLPRLRQIKKVFPAFLKLYPYKMYAETTNKQSTRFVRFLGGEFIRREGDRMLYGWSI